MTRRAPIKQVTTKQLNGSMRPRYLRSLEPEIQDAIDAQYPSTATFISTKRVADEITDRPWRYPILGEAEPFNLKIIISRYFSEVANYPLYSSSHNGSRGRIFIRRLPKEVMQQHGAVTA